MNNFDVKREDLTGVLAEVVELLDNVEDLTPLSATLALSEYFAGSPVYFPTVRTGTITARNRQIMKDYQAKMPMRDMAKKYGLSAVHINDILEKQMLSCDIDNLLQEDE
jgi:Mor family transcriptional regulator